MDQLNHDIQFYKNSLCQAETEIETIHKTGKALKDIIGLAYETHRKRIWNYFGFDVSKDKCDARFDVDWSITYKEKLVAFEEDKGHYVDSCFLERALTGFCKTVNTYKKTGKEVPVLILHSFTRYNKYNEKLEEDLETRNAEIRNEIKTKLVYTTLSNCDRLSRKKWFSNDFYKCYSNNVNDELIIKDIQFIRSLIPDFE